MPSQRVWTSLAITLSMAPVAAVAASFDTIVIDDNLGSATGNGASAVGQRASRRDAQRIAMSNFTLRGNISCKVKVTYRQCEAYASSARTGGTGVGPTMTRASAAALSKCGDQTCRVVVADCVGQPLNPPR